MSVDDVFTLEMLDHVVEVIRRQRPVIKPLVSDDGFAFYIWMSTRERLIDGLRPGWTFRAVTFGDGTHAAYDSVPIDDWDRTRNPMLGFIDHNFA